MENLAILILLALGLTRAQPTASSLNSAANLHTNQLTNGDSHVKEPVTTGQFVFSSNPRNPQVQPLPSQSYSQPGYQQTSSSYPAASYVRDPQSSPFFGLASNGEIQLSAYFSQLFWGFVAVTVTIALIIYLIRAFVPGAGAGLIKKISDTTSGRAIDLDRITNVVYGALDSFGKLKEGSHAKTR